MLRKDFQRVRISTRPEDRSDITSEQARLVIKNAVAQAIKRTQPLVLTRFDVSARKDGPQS